jgi:serine/threonine-protein kinase HipA
MRLRALDVYLGQAHVGQLFQYGEGRTAITRLTPDPIFWRNRNAPVWSISALTESAADREQLLAQAASLPLFNGNGSRLPPFFQNLLPEGPLRRHLAQIRNCQLDDHFEILAGCGTDLPGAIYVYPAAMNGDTVSNIVTQNHETVEMSVTAEPMAEATSLSGVQPKWSLVETGGRYVSRTKNLEGMHIIAKLPTVDFPLLPEVEELSLRLAAAAGVATCEAALAPMAAISDELPYPQLDAKQFLAVRRFDRAGGAAHVHCEDFAQILGIEPEDKYDDPRATYANMARVMLEIPSMGEAAVLELIRRITVNELLGNYDAHVKNFGVVYLDGRTPTMSPAYDVVAYAIYINGRGHGLRFTGQGGKQQYLTPAVVRAFCQETKMFESQLQSVIRKTARQAISKWPEMIAESKLPQAYKTRLLAHFESVPMVQSQRKRSGL